MSERDGYEHGVPCWVDIWCSDADRAAEFYARLFGWEVIGGANEPEIRHLICRRRGRDVAAIGSRPDVAGPPAWGTYVWVDDLDATAARVLEAGGRLEIEPFQSLDGGRMAVIADPEGAVIGAWQPATHSGAGLVSEPGAWSMSILRARDSEAAKRFYAAVFGWQAEPFAGGQLTLFRLPGYVGGEPTQPVPRDVVATMAPADDGSAWGVDFWIDDANHAAAVAAEAGGKVLAGPYEFPDGSFRQAVLADPEGATFTVSQLLVPAG
jgi:predicted enzyme related to lactoylglutathione lyase